MNDQDKQELNAIIQILGPAIQQAVGEGVYHALKRHHEETTADLAIAEVKVDRWFKESEPTKEHLTGEALYVASELAKSKVEISGEREVWAQAYAAQLAVSLGNYPKETASMHAIITADAAVKAFRERYK